VHTVHTTGGQLTLRQSQEEDKQCGNVSRMRSTAGWRCLLRI